MLYIIYTVYIHCTVYNSAFGKNVVGRVDETTYGLYNTGYYCVVLQLQATSFIALLAVVSLLHSICMKTEIHFESYQVQ